MLAGIDHEILHLQYHAAVITEVVEQAGATPRKSLGDMCWVHSDVTGE
jgi:hypothetical protein